MRTTLPSLALAAAGLLPLGAHAATIVDTGFNAAGNMWTFYAAQGLAASFSVGSTVTIDSVEGYFRVFGAAATPVTVSLYANSPGGTALYTGSSFIPAGQPANWHGVSGLGNWTIGPGTYTVAFTTSDLSGQTVLLGNAPNRLGVEYYGGAPNWNRFDGLDLGVRIMSVSAVPEPGAWAMLLAGLGAVGFTARRRQAASA
jgi:PEP-CTERM motif